MDENDVTEATLTAAQHFNFIINQIRNSCLNFQLKVTPFSATISLKNSIVKDKIGIPLPLTSLQSESVLSNEATLLRIRALESEVLSIQNKYQEAMPKVMLHKSRLIY